MRALRPSLVVLLAACASCGPSSFPDQGAVSAAQASWCQALGKATGLSADQVATCKGAPALASAPYLRGMAKCFPERKEMLGAKAPDTGVLVAQCNDEVTVKLSFEDSAQVIDARCERANRCEKVPIPDCVSAVKKLETSQRVLLYGQYNSAGQYKIADCLKSTSCGADEDASRDGCYKPLQDKLLWVP